MSTLLEKHESSTPAAGEWQVEPRRSLDTAAVLLLVVSAGFLLAVGWGAISHWWSEYRQPESYYAYAPVVPFIVALMFWHRREALKAAPKRPCYWALAVLIPSLALEIVATKQEMWAVDTAAFLATIWSGVWLVLGTRFVRAAVFPLAFITTMAPLPGPILNDGTFTLQQLSIHGAVKLLQLLTFQPSLSGNVINLENYSVFVDVPCSGFHLLLALITSGAALAYLLDGPPLRRILLFLIGMPLSLAVNITRLTLLCIVGDCFGTTVASVFHDWDGLLTVGLGVALLLAIAKRLGCRTFAGWPLF